MRIIRFMAVAIIITVAVAVVVYYLFPEGLGVDLYSFPTPAISH
jgi:hypothetical protein